MFFVFIIFSGKLVICLYENIKSFFFCCIKLVYTFAIMPVPLPIYVVTFLIYLFICLRYQKEMFLVEVSYNIQIIEVQERFEYFFANNMFFSGVSLESSVCVFNLSQCIYFWWFYFVLEKAFTFFRLAIILTKL